MSLALRVRRTEERFMNDQFILALCAWRENRSGQTPGMQSVCNSVANRMKTRGQSAYQVVTARKQYSSMTAPGDPQLGLYPTEGDAQWIEAQALAGEALAGTLPDITGGATSYYAVDIPEIPWWAPSMTLSLI